MQRHHQDTTCPSLLSRVRNPDDHTAWREFEGRYAELVMRYCCARGVQPADGDDIRQQVWTNLSKGLRTFKYDPSKGRFRDYLGRVVRNGIARHFSRKDIAGRALDSAVLATTPDDASGPDEVWDKEWVNHHYRLAMQTIERSFEPQNVAVFNRLLAGEHAEDVAASFGLTRQAVYQSKHRILQRMRELIAQQIREEDQPDIPEPA